MSAPEDTVSGMPVVLFRDPAEWADWLEENHAASPGLWLRLAKKASSLTSVTYAEALEVALCYGWIDGQKRSYDADSWLQKFTPRGAKSLWSKINREKVLALIESGRMRPSGLGAVELARQDGRWDAAYDPASTATVPEDFQAALDASPAAGAAFAALDGQNRYAMLFRIQTARKPQTRAARITKFVGMLERGEKLYP
ncbi:YdeI family protein [soil metagenome]